MYLSLEIFPFLSSSLCWWEILCSLSQQRNVRTEQEKVLVDVFAFSFESLNSQEKRSFRYIMNILKKQKSRNIYIYICTYIFIIYLCVCIYTSTHTAEHISLKSREGPRRETYAGCCTGSKTTLKIASQNILAVRNSRTH